MLFRCAATPHVVHRIICSCRWRWKTIVVKNIISDSSYHWLLRCLQPVCRNRCNYRFSSNLRPTLKENRGSWERGSHGVPCRPLSMLGDQTASLCIHGIQVSLAVFRTGPVLVRAKDCGNRRFPRPRSRLGAACTQTRVAVPPGVNMPTLRATPPGLRHVGHRFSSLLPLRPSARHFRRYSVRVRDISAATPSERAAQLRGTWCDRLTAGGD